MMGFGWADRRGEKSQENQREGQNREGERQRAAQSGSAGAGRPFARLPPKPVSERAGCRGARRGRPRFDEILSRNALSFVADLHRRFDATRKRLLARRSERQRRFDIGELPDFLAETKPIRDGNWKVAPIPKDLQDRRVEITGPVDRKMVINALNSGADVYMADFEDATSPTWTNLVEGQINLKDYWAGKLSYVEPQTGKRYELGRERATLIVRPRGWHLNEEHVIVDNEPVSGALFDFALYLFHNWKRFGPAKTGAYFYLPKIENHLEARLWNEVFLHAQQRLGRRRAIKATVLIETLPAAFEMDEILYELREHITGLNCRPLGLHLPFIKRLGKNKRFLTPDAAP
jgi:malate synthase